MILQQAIMKLSNNNKGGVVSKIDKLVMLWKEVGLCIHKNEYGWVISHFNSGKLILRLIKTKEQAKEYMQHVHDEVMEDWTFTLEEWESVDQETKSNVKVGMDALQQEILQKGV